MTCAHQPLACRPDFTAKVSIFRSPAKKSLLLHSEMNYIDMAEVKTTELMRTSQSWDGTTLPAFPQGNAEIVAMRYEFQPGEKLSWHHHDVINFGYVQQGELTIIDINGNVKVVRAGEAVVEMVGTIHHGENNGNETVILTMFYVAAAGMPLSVQHPELPIG